MTLSPASQGQVLDTTLLTFHDAVSSGLVTGRWAAADWMDRLTGGVASGFLAGSGPKAKPTIAPSAANIAAASRTSLSPLAVPAWAAWATAARAPGGTVAATR